MGISSIIFVYISHKYNIELWLNGIKTEAKVVNVKFKKVRGGSRSSSGYSYVTTVSYNNEKGETFKKEISFDSFKIYKNGDTVTVIYPPNHPELAVLKDSLEADLDFTDNWLLFLFPFMFFGGSAYFYWFKNNG